MLARWWTTYQEEARKALIDRERGVPARVAGGCGCGSPLCSTHARRPRFVGGDGWIDNLANDILELSAAQIDAFAAESKKARTGRKRER